MIEQCLGQDGLGSIDEGVQPILQGQAHLQLIRLVAQATQPILEVMKLRTPMWPRHPLLKKRVYTSIWL